MNDTQHLTMHKLARTHIANIRKAVQVAKEKLIEECRDSALFETGDDKEIALTYLQDALEEIISDEFIYDEMEKDE